MQNFIVGIRQPLKEPRLTIRHIPFWTSPYTFGGIDLKETNTNVNIYPNKLSNKSGGKHSLSGFDKHLKHRDSIIRLSSLLYRLFDD